MYKTKPMKIAIGSVLGDGSLRPADLRGTSALDVSQHNSKLPYLKWLYSELNKGFDLNPIFPKKGFNLHRFVTKSSLELGELRNTFYHGGRKSIPSNIGDILDDPISLAVWYMDDGTLDRRNKYHFNSMFASYCFTFEECEALKNVLQDNFGVKISVTRCKMRGKYYPRLYIWSESMEKFVDTIKPFVHPIFKYKISI